MLLGWFNQWLFINDPTSYCMYLENKSEMKEQPFYIGQRVVCVKDHSRSIVNKGLEYVCLGLLQFPCGCWNIGVGVKKTLPKYTCPIHNLTATNSYHCWWISASLFAPITNNFIEIEYSKVLELEKPLISVQ